MLVPNRHGSSTAYRYGFQGQEKDDELKGEGNSLNMEARMLDPRVGRWFSRDPLEFKFPWQSPYCSMDNNPILLTDPTGMSTNPIYDKKGSFLGTDDKGLQGSAIVMDKKDFKQGMKHGDAVKLNKGVSALSTPEAKAKFANHYYELPSRPDFDGYVSISEGINWAKAHPNLDNDNIESNGMGNATPNDWLYVDASKMNFGTITTADLILNEVTPVNLLYHTNFASSSSIATTYALGRTTLKLLNENGAVQAVNGTQNIYNWDRGGNTFRRGLIDLERKRTSINDSHGFPLYIYGTGKVKKYKPLEFKE
jgi:RHS repeat-associated protein